MNDWLRPDRPLIIAHRGHILDAPEQTMAAYELAVMLGADMIEADVRRTRDGRLVMLHDATLERTTNGTGPLETMDLDALRALDAGSWFDARFNSQPVPLLDELFEMADARGVSLCLEIKSSGPGQGGQLAVAVAHEIARRGRLGRDVLASFDHAALAEAARRFPGLVLAPDRLPERGTSSAPALIAQAKALGAPIIQHHHADLSSRTVAACHAAGVALWAWPTTTVSEIEHAHQLGCDALMGDDVAAIRRHLGGAAAVSREP